MVEWKKLEEVCEFKRGRTITAKDAVDGNVPVIAGGQTPSYYHNEANREGESITVAGSGAYAGFISYWNQPIFVSDAFTVDPNDILIHKYLYQWLKMHQDKVYAIQRGAGVPHVHGKDIANFLIPIPSLQEQERIVGILDTFTASIDNLKEQIEQRRKQYEHYRDQLLDLEGKEVEWKKLGDLLDFEQPTQYLVKSTEYDDAYDTPVLTAGQSLLLGYTDEKDGIYKADKKSPTIIFDDFTTSFHWIDYSFKVKSSAMKMLRPKKNVCFRYVFYAMKCIGFIPGGHQRHWISKYSQFEIPYPSLQEQERIVGILDTFTASIQNLEAQLEQRQKQYEYYREKLLTFER